MLRINTLGGLTITRDGEAVTQLATRKVAALLVYLACTQRAHAREVLAELLWEERPPERALGNLRVALTSLRKHLGDYVLITRDTVAINPEAEVRLDARSLEEDLRAGQIEAAVALYQDEFLQGFYLRGAPGFDGWATQERERLHLAVVDALHRQVDRDLAGGAFRTGIEHALRLLALDPLLEPAHRQMMLLLAASGQRSAALTQYKTCREVLAKELGVEPGEQTIRLYEQIRDGELEIPPGAPVLIVQPEPIQQRPSFLDEAAEDVEPPVFVARERELARLDALLESALQTKGQVVFVTGGPGRGKTALLAEFARRAMTSHPTLLVASGSCNAYAGIGDPYLPFREVMGMLTGDVEPLWAAGTISRDHALRLWHALPVMVQALVDRGPDLLPILVPGAALFSRATAAAPRDAPWLQHLWKCVERGQSHPEGFEQSHLFQQVTDTLRVLARTHPLLLILDDLQWTDTASTGLLFHLGRRLEGSRILVAGAHRPEEVALGRHGERHPLEKVLSEFKRTYGAVLLDLAEIKQSEGQHFVEAILKTEPNRLGEDFRRVLFERTGGHPLFTIELLRAMQERGDLRRDEAGRWVCGPALDWEALPPRVEGVIEERISQLEEELHETLTVASVEGETFTAQVVARAQEIGQRRLLQNLSQQLQWRHRLVQEQGELQVGPQRLSRYRFAHALHQQYLYDRLSPGERRLLHGEIAEILEDLYGEHTESIAVQLARHYSAAGQVEKAVEYLLQAGDRARGLYAHQEAIEHYRQAFKFLEKAGDLERGARTLMKLGLTYHTVFQFQQARQAYEEGLALWQRAAEMEPVVPPPSAPHALRLLMEDEPLTLDPSMGPGEDTFAVVNQLYSGLVDLGLEMDIVPDIAQHWEIGEAGRKYVFHLRDDAHWSDGVPVTARDFQFAWLRMLDPATDPAIASLLYDIKGAKAFHQGSVASPDGVGVRAPDDLTLIVELEQPTGYFLHLLASMYPVPRHIVDAHGEAWTELGNIVTNGPFRLEDTRPGRLMTLSRNPEYHGRFRGNVKRVELKALSYPESRSRMTLYEADEVDVVRLPHAEISLIRQRHAGEYVTGPELFTTFLWFDVSCPPFDDRRVRQAFALATDTKRVMDVILEGAYQSATGGFVPPGMPGHSPGIGLPYDPGHARQLLVEAGYPGGRGFPAVQAPTTWEFGESVAEYQQMQWRQELGIDVAWEGVDWAMLLDRLENAPPQMSVYGCAANYPDPDSFLRQGVTDARRFTRWRNETYDRLVEEARRSMDQAQRMELYRQADRILIEEAAIVPIRYGRSHVLVKPWVKRFPMSAMREWYPEDVVLEPH